MIDQDDSDFLFLAGIGTPGWLGIALLVAAIVFAVIASNNADGCEDRACEHGSAKLLEGECVCVEAPK